MHMPRSLKFVRKSLKELSIGFKNSRKGLRWSRASHESDRASISLWRGPRCPQGESQIQCVRLSMAACVPMWKGRSELSQTTGKGLQTTEKSFLSITDTNKWTNVLRMSERGSLTRCSKSPKALQLFLLWLQLPRMALKHLFFTCDPFRQVSLTILRPVLSGGVWSTWGPFVNTLEGSRHVRSCLKMTGEGRLRLLGA